MDNFEKEMLNKIDNKQNLTEDELCKLIWEYEIKRDEGDCYRWTQDIESIIELGDRYFSIYWDKGLTEYQEHEYNYQPQEVKPIEYIQTKVVKEYIGVNDNEERYIKEHNGERI